MRKVEKEMKRVGAFLKVLDTQVIYSAFTSSYYAFKAHQYISRSMVIYTTLAVIFLVESKAFIFQFPKIFGMDLGYYASIMVALIFGYFLADYLERAKIAQIRNFWFSHGSNALTSFVVGIGITFALIMINTFGTEKGAEFSYRYMNKKMLESVEIGLDKESLSILKQNSNQIAKQSSFTLERENIKALQRHRKEIINNPDKYTKRNLAVQDWKIKQALDDLAKKQDNQNRLLASVTQARLQTLNNLKHKIVEGKEKNLEVVNSKKEWAMKVAIWGEIVDAFFIIAYLLLHKSNPSLNTVPTVIKGRRETVTQDDFLKINSFSQKHLKKAKKPLQAPKQHKPKVHIQEGDDITDKEIYQLNIEYGKELGNYINGYLKQPSQARFLKWLKESKNKTIHTTRLAEYNRRFLDAGKLSPLKNNQGYIMVDIRQDREVA